MPRIDLNSDMGESFGLYNYGEDEAAIKFVSSANLACGFHAGDPVVIATSVELAKSHNVAVGAHVGFPDLMGFGRRPMTIKPSDLNSYVTYQMGALIGFLKTADLTLHHIKPHGALYMMALEDENYAEAILDATMALAPDSMIYTIRDSATWHVALKKGIRPIPEFFADRGYHADGRVKMFDWSLAEAGDSHKAIAERVVQMITTGGIDSFEGGTVSVEAETVCVHSDTPGAADILSEIHKKLTAKNIEIKTID
ncbi:MAG: LamB/YcsF family protein [Lentisphaeria bacterium]|nr:LamB/YcsF family protein [Lentisphaeria bacterium]